MGYIPRTDAPSRRLCKYGCTYMLNPVYHYLPRIGISHGGKARIGCYLFRASPCNHPILSSLHAELGAKFLPVDIIVGRYRVRYNCTYLLGQIMGSRPVWESRGRQSGDRPTPSPFFTFYFLAAQFVKHETGKTTHTRRPVGLPRDLGLAQLGSQCR